MRLFGLIGKKLQHSFSKKYFTEKFEREGITNARYDLFELPEISFFPQLLENNPDLVGLNVTIPYKEEVISYLKSLDRSAEIVGAVNVIKFEGSELVGYNSDYYGFQESLKKLLPKNETLAALILGTGGASKAVQAALKDLGILFRLVSRSGHKSVYSYEDLHLKPEIVAENKLIINTTPIGMSPHADKLPDIPYSAVSKHHILFDLIYNPEETRFLEEGKKRGAITKNGLEMLHLQAEKAWEIWQK